MFSQKCTFKSVFQHDSSRIQLHRTILIILFDAYSQQFLDSFPSSLDLLHLGVISHMTWPIFYAYDDPLQHSSFLEPHRHLNIWCCLEEYEWREIHFWCKGGSTNKCRDGLHVCHSIHSYARQKQPSKHLHLKVHISSYGSEMCASPLHFMDKNNRGRGLSCGLISVLESRLCFLSRGVEWSVWCSDLKRSGPNRNVLFMLLIAQTQEKRQKDGGAELWGGYEKSPQPPI